MAYDGTSIAMPWIMSARTLARLNASPPRTTRARTDSQPGSQAPARPADRKRPSQSASPSR